MIVKGHLVPLLWHFGQMVAAKEAPDHTGGALGCGTEIMGELELLLLVAVGAHHALHDLHEHAGRVVAQGGVRGIDHLIVEHTQTQKPVLGLGSGRFEVVQKVDNSIGHARGRSVHQLLDAVRMQVGIGKQVSGRAGSKNAIDKLQDIVVTAIKIHAWQGSAPQNKKIRGARPNDAARKPI